MADINLVIHGRKSAAPVGKPLSASTPYDGRFGFEGLVTELHPENNTVHVRTPEGRIISNVKVSSPVWVTIDKDKDFLSGKRYLPPIDTYVLVFMPNGEYSSATIIASVFSSDPQHSAFKEDSDNAKEINDSIENSGWKYTDDKRTGTRLLQNKPEDPTIKIEVDQEKEGDEKVTITIHGNIFTVDKDNGIKIETDKNVDLSVKGDVTVAVDGNMSADVKGDMTAEVKGKTGIKSTGAVNVESSADVAVKGINATVEASAMLTLKSGDAAPWMPNCVPACPWGFPHGGPSAGIVKLKGG
jgi:hypothetical protein